MILFKDVQALYKMRGEGELSFFKKVIIYDRPKNSSHG